ncbi:MAG: hypothetical protein ACHQAY_08690 [Hyphomicrobiales bacterium]
MSPPEFPDKGLLWRGWDDTTLRIINEKQRPVLLFVADTDPAVWPFLREVLREMPTNAKLRTLLHETYTALYIEPNALPEELKALGAGNRYHIAVLSPHGLTPIVTIDPVRGRPPEVVDEIVLILERLRTVWR